MWNDVRWDIRLARAANWPLPQPTWWRLQLDLNTREPRPLIWPPVYARFLTDFLHAGIRRPTQDPPLSGGSCPGARGWRHRGWPCGGPARVWSHQVGWKKKTVQTLILNGFIINKCLMQVPPVGFSYVVVMPNKRQALVEYEDMNGSSTAVTYAADNQVYIAGHPAFINYSTSKKISRPGDSDDSRSVNNVLLFTIMNPIYPITTVNEPWGMWRAFVSSRRDDLRRVLIRPIQATKHPWDNSH